jgi:hypothetical protein
MLSIGSEIFSIGFYYIQNISRKFSLSYSIFLKKNGVFLSNESNVRFRYFSLKFISNSQISKSQGSHKINSNFTIALSLSKFKFVFPITISTEPSLFTNSFICLSFLLGSLFMKLRKGFYSNSFAKQYSILNKINTQKYEDFISNHLENYEKKVSLLNSPDMIINFAFVGVYEKIYEIYKNLKIFQNFLNFDSLVFDVKIQLGLHMVNSKLTIPKNFLEIDGLFIPDYKNRDNLAITIMYTYNFNKYYTIIGNFKKDVNLPFENSSTDKESY